MCVRQPDPGSRTINIGLDTGHAWWHIETTLGLMEFLQPADPLLVYADHSWGYWPVSQLGPGSSGITVECNGELKNDDYQASSVYMRYEIPFLGSVLSLLQFTYNIEHNPGIFHISNNNCTTIAIAAAEAANVSVPKFIRDVNITIPEDYGGGIYQYKGYNPADMGEDLVLEGGIRGNYTFQHQ